MRALVIFGVTGRMGQMLVRALREAPALHLSGAVASSASSRLGQDAAGDGTPSGVLITSDAAAALRGAAVALDFSVGSAVAAHASECAAAGVPILIGATGLDAGARGALEQAARKVAVLVAPNTSVGVSVAAQLVSIAALGLGPSFDVEILDVHHRAKRDAPSGTALALGQAVADARGQAFEDAAICDRAARAGVRRPGSIGFSSLRGGDVVGEHTVSFAADGERIEVTHRATDRMIFARGALRGADWLLEQPPGLYGMKEVLGL